MKIVETSKHTDLYLDDEFILFYQSTAEPLQFFTTGYDEVAGELIVKAVNAASTPYSTKIRLDGAKQVEKTGK